MSKLSQYLPKYLPMLRSILSKCFLVSFLVVLGAPHESSGQQPRPPERGPRWQGSEGWPKWPDQDWLESALKDAAKKLDIVKGFKRPGSDIESLQSKASDLLKQSNQAKNNFWKCERLVNAASSLLDAAYCMYASRKSDDAQADFLGVGRILQGFIFRVQQADYFVQAIPDKNSELYVTLARSMYQQARSAYDAREFQKAKYLVDASSNIVTALESIAQAAIPPPPIQSNVK
jgi:hypothetical protein